MTIPHAHDRDCRHQFGEDWPDISFVTPTIAIGGYIHEEDVEELREIGITHVLNVNWPDRPEPQAVLDTFVHLDIAILDDGLPKPATWFQAGIDFAASMGPNDRLLVHCGHGINRSPAMAYAILRARGHTDAVEMIRAARPQAGSGGTGAWLDVYRVSADAIFA